MKRKKFLAGLVSMMVIATTLVGCSGGSTEEASTSQTETPKKEETSQSTDKAQTDSKDETKGTLMPYAGDEIVYKGYAADLGIKEVPGSPVLEEWNKMKGNVRIEWQSAPFADYDEKIKLFLASGDIPDIIWLRNSPTQIAMYGDNGYFLDWNKYIDYMPNLQAYQEKYPQLDFILTDEGQRYAITDIQPVDACGEAWFANKTLLDKYGIAMPNNLDEFLDALRAVKAADPNIIPFQSVWNISNLKSWMSRLIDAQSSEVFYNENTQKFEFTTTSPDGKRKELIELIATMYKEGLIHPEVATLSWEQENAIIASNNWAFSALYTVAPEGEVYKVAKGADMPVDVEMFFMESESGKKYAPLAYQHDTLPYWGYFANADVKNPEVLASYVDLIISEEASKLYNYGIEGLTYEIAEDGTYKATEQLVNSANPGEEFGYSQILDTRYIQLKPAQTNGLTPHKKQDEWTKQIEAGLISGELTPQYSKATAVFGQADNEEKARILSTLQTYIDEQEAKFIYGQRPMSEWDNYVEELKKLADINRLEELYNSAEIIKFEADRIYK